MKFRIVHNNFNVLDLQKSIDFYDKAFGLKVARIKEASDGSFKLAFLEMADGGHQIELTWLRDRKESYNLGDNEIHLAMKVDDYETAHALHKEMGVICYENSSMGLYFVEDPDGYWIEVIPEKRN